MNNHRAIETVEPLPTWGQVAKARVFFGQFDADAHAKQFSARLEAHREDPREAARSLLSDWGKTGKWCHVLLVASHTLEDKNVTGWIDRAASLFPHERERPNPEILRGEANIAACKTANSLFIQGHLLWTQKGWVANSATQPLSRQIMMASQEMLSQMSWIPNLDPRNMRLHADDLLTRCERAATILRLSVDGPAQRPARMSAGADGRPGAQTTTLNLWMRGERPAHPTHRPR